MKSRYGRDLFSCFFLPGGAGSLRLAAVKGAPLRRGVSEPLTARTAVKASSGEEKERALPGAEFLSSRRKP
jgi:hypothetical protein